MLPNVLPGKNAGFRFIYIMRHPFARIESNIRHQMFWEKLDAEAIESIKKQQGADKR